MAALSITAANVRHQSAVVQQAVCGVAINAGQALYIDSTGKAQLLTNATLLGSGSGASQIGIAVNNAGANQLIDYVKKGIMNIGATTVQGQPYYAGVGGGIIPVDDFAGGEYVTALGHALDATGSFNVDINAQGVTKTGAVT